MKINLTLNKPATTSFIAALAGGVLAGLKLKIADGKLFIRPSATEKGPGVFPTFTRTRGGLGVTIEGRFAEQFIAETGLGCGSHMALSPTSHKWVAGEAVPMGTKPSKIVPTARLWREVDEVQTKSAKPAAAVKKTVKAAVIAKASAGAKKVVAAKKAAPKAKTAKTVH